jgi:hypothetical protein
MAWRGNMGTLKVQILANGNSKCDSCGNIARDWSNIHHSENCIYYNKPLYYVDYTNAIVLGFGDENKYRNKCFYEFSDMDKYLGKLLETTNNEVFGGIDYKFETKTITRVPDFNGVAVVECKEKKGGRRRRTHKRTRKHLKRSKHTRRN